MRNIWILAEADGQGQTVGMEPAGQTDQTTTSTSTDGSNSTTDPGNTPKPGLDPIQIVIFGGIFVLMWFMMFRGPKKKQQEHQKMVSSLSKNDRVRTIGGIFATVLDVRDDEIVLKIDESTNTKMRVVPSAIATVLKDGKKE